MVSFMQKAVDTHGFSRGMVTFSLFVSGNVPWCQQQIGKGNFDTEFEPIRKTVPILTQEEKQLDFLKFETVPYHYGMNAFHGRTFEYLSGEIHQLQVQLQQLYQNAYLMQV